MVILASPISRTIPSSIVLISLSTARMNSRERVLLLAAAAAGAGAGAGAAAAGNLAPSLLLDLPFVHFAFRIFLDLENDGDVSHNLVP